MAARIAGECKPPGGTAFACQGLLGRQELSPRAIARRRARRQLYVRRPMREARRDLRRHVDRRDPCSVAAGAAAVFSSRARMR